MKNLGILLTAVLVFGILPALSAQDLAKDQMIATWHFSVAEEVEAETLETFVEKKYLPAVHKHYEGIDFYFLQSERGTNEGHYSILLVFESIDARNEWWPERGVSSEKATKASEQMTEIREKFQSLIKMESWDDWLILK